MEPASGEQFQWGKHGHDDVREMVCAATAQKEGPAFTTSKQWDTVLRIG